MGYGHFHLILLKMLRGGAASSCVICLIYTALIRRFLTELRQKRVSRESPIPALKNRGFWGIPPHVYRYDNESTKRHFYTRRFDI